MFRKEEFVEMLVNIMHVPAVAVDDGIILDRKAFNSISPAHMPHWAWMNKRDINNEFHIRAATTEEIELLK